MKKVVKTNKTAESFVESMKKAFPELSGEAGLEELGKVLYK